MVSREEIKEKINQIKWHHQFEIINGLFTPGSYSPDGLLKRLNLPTDLSGKRMLDIGARDGFFTLQAVKRGASVIAVDYMPADQMGFNLTMQANGVREVEFIQTNVYELPQLDLGTFDIILFLGVIYHVPDPYLSLEIVQSLTKEGGTCYVESTNLDASFTLNEVPAPLPDQYRSSPLAVFVRRNMTSYWDMNEECLRQLINDVGFTVKRAETWGKRVLFEAEAVYQSDKERAKTLSRGIVKRSPREQK